MEIKETDRKAKIPLTQGLFPKGTVGYNTFPKELEGRVRPLGVFENKAPFVYGLQNQDIEAKTMGDILNLDVQEGFRKATRINIEAVGSNFFNHVLVGSEGFFLEELMEKRVKDPISTSAEEQRAISVKQTIDGIPNPETRELLKERYGLDSGIEIKRDSRGVNKALEGLRDKRTLSALRYFLPLEDSNFAKQKGYTCLYDIYIKYFPDAVFPDVPSGVDPLIESPLGTTTLQELNLRPKTLREIAKSTGKDMLPSISVLEAIEKIDTRLLHPNSLDEFTSALEQRNLLSSQTSSQ